MSEKEELKEGLVELELEDEVKETPMVFDMVVTADFAMVEESDLIKSLDKGRFYVVDMFDEEHPVFVNLVPDDDKPASFDSYNIAKSFAESNCQVPAVIRRPERDEETHELYNPVMRALNDRVVCVLGDMIDTAIVKEESDDNIENLETALEIMEYFK